MTEFDSRFDDIDVESILARVGKREPFTFSRRRCIYHAPEFTQRLPAHESVEEGSTITFGCKVLGFPKPTVTWYKDDDVIGLESRAELTTDDNGVYSIKLQDVSKCDAGAYKVSATNLEGSSSSSLCITVKAKAKSRNRKKKVRAVACIPLFPVIVEHEAEERRETLAAEQQDDSPLTPLYSSISRKSPVTWPAFLGDWAYNREDGSHHDLDDLEIECEDVFDVEPDHPTQESRTFVSSGYENKHDEATEVKPNNEIEESVQVMNKTNEEHTKNVNFETTAAGNVGEIIKCDPTENQPLVKASKDIKPPNSLNLVSTVIERNACLDKDKDIINNNKSSGNSAPSNEKGREILDTGVFKVPPKEIEEESLHYDPSEVSRIAVNRSYAKGNSTFSMATRSSPYRTLRDRSSSPCNGSGVKMDTSTLQNLNNERLLKRMRQSERFSLSSSLLSVLTWTGSTEDHLAEMILLICGCTFLALFFDLSPATFVFDIIVALLVKLVVNFVFQRL